MRHRLPEERPSLTHKFSISGHEGYITVGLYPNGQPGEIFIKMAKEGSTVSGLMDAFATAISLSLQHGVPLKVLCEKFSHLRFEPSGWTGNEQIGFAKSIMDYIFRWLQLRFLSGTQLPLFAGLAAQAAQLNPKRALRRNSISLHVAWGQRQHRKAGFYPTCMPAMLRRKPACGWKIAAWSTPPTRCVVLSIWGMLLPATPAALL